MPSVLQQAVELLRQSVYTVALTGAGISTASGIPDFRGTNSSLGRHADPLEVASIWAFHERPEVFYRWIGPVMQKMMVAQPNAAHQVLAAMENQDILKAVLTQNIDSLHQQAGSRHVVELHGHVRTATCLSCQYRTAGAPLWPHVLAGGPPPICPQCGGPLKPDVILYGEPVPYGVLAPAQQEALRCEVMLVIGTALEVMPAADLPLLARRRGARLILVNLTPTSMDEQADVVIRADVVKTLQEMWRLLKANTSWVGP